MNINTAETGLGTLNSEHLEQYFVKSKSGIEATLKASMSTEKGEELVRDAFPDNLKSFLNIPEITTEIFVENPRSFYSLITDDAEVIYTTSGTSGSKKEVIYPRSCSFIKRDLDPELVALFKEKNSLLLLDRDSEEEGSGVTIVRESLKEILGKDPRTKLFTMPDEAIKNIIESKVDNVYISLTPSLARLLISGLAQIKQENPESLLSLKGKSVFFELSGERINIDELNKWNNIITTIFGEHHSQISRFVAVYGTYETLMLGIYRWKKDDIIPKYEIPSNQFCLVLDNDNQPILNKRGRLETTPLNRTKGTILWRYLTGDIAEMVYEDGKFYLIDPKRDEKKPQLSIFGEKITHKQLEEISGYLHSKNFPIELEYLTQQTTIGKFLLTIIVHGINQQNYENFKIILVDYLKKYFPIFSQAVSGKAYKIQILSNPKSIHKSYKVTNDTSLLNDNVFNEIHSEFNLV